MKDEFSDFLRDVIVLLCTDIGHADDALSYLLFYSL